MDLRDMPGFAATADGLTRAISAFDNKDLAFAIALGILLGAVLVWAFLHWRRHRTWVWPIRDLTRGLRRLEATESPAEQRLDEADALFRRHPRLEPLWREYRKHLVRNDRAEGYVNLMDPRLWFSLEALPGRGYEQWCATWAGVFLTVGLLFTFLGLSAALLKVGGIDGADSAAMKAAITGILGVSSAKFITSIAGLIAYIGFSLVTRRYQTSQQAAARDLADAVQHLSVPLSPELLLHEQNQVAQKQLTRLERLDDDLAIAIDKRLQERLAELATNLGNDLGRMQTALPEATADPIVAALGQIGDTIAQSNTQGMDAVLARVAELADRLGAVTQGMGGAGADFGREIREAAEALKAAATGIGTGMAAGSSVLANKLAESSMRFEAIFQTFDRIPGQIDTALGKTLEQLTVAVGTLDARLRAGGDAGAQALTEGARGAGAALKGMADKAGQGLSTRLDEASARLGGAVETAGDGMAASVGRAADAFEETVKATTAGLQSAIRDLAARLQTVEASLNGLPPAVAAQVAQLATAGDAFKAAGQAAMTASLAVQRAAGPLAQSADAIDTGLELTQELVAQAQATQQETAASLREALEGLKSAAEAASRTFRTHEERFGQVDETLASALTNLRDGVAEVATATQRVFAEYDTHISKAVGGLSSVAENLQEAAEDLVDATQRRP